MSLLARIFGRDRRESLRPLWHATVATSREPEWYREGQVADTLDGRFDMIALVLSLVLLRMEKSEALVGPAALLTELFVADMDRQLRDTGVGDLMVGKKMGKLMGAIGGRMGALRTALADSDDAALAGALERNVALLHEQASSELVARTRALVQRLAQRSDDELLEGTIGAA